MRLQHYCRTCVIVPLNHHNPRSEGIFRVLHRVTYELVGEIHFRFIGPAAYGDRVMTKVSLEKMGVRTLHWNCIATNATSGDLICEGRAVRVYARIKEDGNLESQPIPDFMRKTLEELGAVKQLGSGLITDSELDTARR